MSVAYVLKHSGPWRLCMGYGELVSCFQPCRWRPGQRPDAEEPGWLRPRLRTLGESALRVAPLAPSSFVHGAWEASLLL